MASFHPLHTLLQQRIALIDGAMGTMVQRYKLDEAAYRGDQFAQWDGKDLKGNNEILLLTRPAVIEEIHTQYLEAGSDIIETNTFSATTIGQHDFMFREEPERRKDPEFMERVITDPFLCKVSREMNLEAARIARRALIAEQVQNFLLARRETNKPFFLYYALNLPHANNEAGKNSPLGHGLECPSYGEFAKKDWPDVEKGFAQFMRFVDGEVGAVAAAVKKLGMDENTVIMFSSDNGPHAEGLHDSDFFRSNGGLNGIKRSMTDGGIRVPFIVRWPLKVKPAGVSEHLSGFQDFLPTVAELAGASIPGECDGISLVPTLLSAGQQRQHPFLYWSFDEQGGKTAVLKWPWKLIHLNTGGHSKRNSAGKAPQLEVQLFNLSDDAGELRNVAAAHPDLVVELQRDMAGAYRPPAN